MENLLTLCLFILCFETGKYCLQLDPLLAVERKLNLFSFHPALSVVLRHADWSTYVSQNMGAAKQSRGAVAYAFIGKWQCGTRLL